MTIQEQLENARIRKEQARSAKELYLIDLVIRNLEYKQRSRDSAK